MDDQEHTPESPKTGASAPKKPRTIKMGKWVERTAKAMLYAGIGGATAKGVDLSADYLAGNGPDMRQVKVVWPAETSLAMLAGGVAANMRDEKKKKKKGKWQTREDEKPDVDPDLGPSVVP